MIPIRLIDHWIGGRPDHERFDCAVACAPFGVGTTSGTLGNQATQVFGPETGWLGLLMNAAVTYFLWRPVMGAR